MMLVQAQISASNSRITSLEKQQQKIKDKITVLEERILTTPQVERGFKVLDRDYENIKEKYEELKEKEAAARLSQSMEEQSKAERFWLLEPPQLPLNPVKPSISKILLMGLFAVSALTTSACIRSVCEKRRITRDVVLPICE